ncbi:glycoside hydrolase family 15 protein [Methanococcoides sp. LMO-2]|uniref:Glycoside hydrolase family 15 protein n=1 Tax=Methanococcoides cohabitans TaxID=3136559 RepID=A0ABU9KT29_9EURY
MRFLIRHPNAILGNDRLLVSMGEKGNILGFFYPRRDGAQHVVDSGACLYTGGRLIWLDSHEWNSKQTVEDGTNIINTHLSHSSGIEVSIQDLVHNEMPVLVRKYEITSKEHLNGKFYYYSNFQVGGTSRMNSAYYDVNRDMLVHYMHDFYIGVATDLVFDEWQVGKTSDKGWAKSARTDMEDGKLQNNMEEIGDIDGTIGLEFDLMPGESLTITILIGIASGRQDVCDMTKDVLSYPLSEIIRGSESTTVEWLSEMRPLELSVLDHDPVFRNEVITLYDRSLLSLNLMTDPDNGAILAAPEFDPAFEMCGGYGFCWNRDAVEAVLALMKAGYPEYAEKFFTWCKRTQMPDGSWFQRYWLDGTEAPSWGNFDDSTQIDETGSTLYAIERYYRELEDPDRGEFLDSIRETVWKSAEYLMGRTEQGLHDPCRCLWESEKGIFPYTNAAIYAGLKGAAHMARESNGSNDSNRAEMWSERADRIRGVTIDKLWLKEGYFSRGIIDNDVRKTVDSSMIGTFVPFGLLSVDDPDERSMILSMIEHIERSLRVPVNGYYGIKRYENDNYIGGNPWVVTTLWLSRSLLTLAASMEERDDEYDRLVNRALEYIKWVMRSATSSGILAEQADKNTGKAAWARPLSWSCALFIENILLLDRLKDSSSKDD